MLVTKNTLKVFIPVLVVLTIASSLAFFITSQLIVAAENVTVGQSATSTAGSVTSHSYSHANATVGADFVLVYVAHRSYEDTTSASFDSTALTFGCKAQGLDYVIEMWYGLLAEGHSGTGTVDVAFSGTVADVIVNSVVFADVDRANPVTSFNCQDTDTLGSWSTTISVDTTSEPNDLVFAGSSYYIGAGGNTAQGGITELWNLGNNLVQSMGGYRNATSTTETMTWTTGNTPWGIASISISPDDAGGSDPGGGTTTPTVLGNSLHEDAGGSATPNAINVDIQSGADFLVLFVAHRTEQTVSSAIINGETMSSGCKANDGLDYHLEMFYLSNLPFQTGVGGSINLTFSGAPNEFTTNLVSVSGVDQSSPITDIVCNATGDSAGTWTTMPMVDVSPDLDNLIIAGHNQYGDISVAPDPINGGTELWDDRNVNVWTNGGSWVADSTTETVGFSYTGNAWPWGIGAIALAGTASGGGGPTGELTVTPSIDDGNIIVDVTSTGTVTVEDLEYSYDQGATWTSIPGADGYTNITNGSYGSTSISAEIEIEAIPYSTETDMDNEISVSRYEVWVRASDDESNIWPASGYTIVSDFLGSGESLYIRAVVDPDNNDDDTINVFVESNQGSLNIDTVEYRIDGGDWSNLRGDNTGTSFQGYLEEEDIPAGTVAIQFRAFDEFNNEWPLAGNYGTLTYDRGVYTGSSLFYLADFEDGIGSVFNSIGDLGDIGDPGTYGYWNVESVSGGKARISNSTFANISNGALTLDGSGDDSVLESIEMYFDVGSFLNDSGYIQEYTYSDNIYVAFDYVLHDNFTSTFESSQQTGNNLEIDFGTTQSLLDIYSQGSLGVYQTFAFRLSDYNDSGDSAFISDILLNFDALYSREAVDLTSIEGYSIDNVRVFHTLADDPLSVSFPTANFSQLPVGSGEVGTVDFVGVASDASANITSINMNYYNGDRSIDGVIAATITDGVLDSQSEAFSFSLDNSILTNDNVFYTFDITITNANGNSQLFQYSTVFVESDPMTLSFSVPPQAVVDVTENITLVGDVRTFFNIADIVSVSLETNLAAGTVSANPVDGAFDDDTEDFNASIPLVRSDEGLGGYSIVVRATSSAGEEQTRTFTGGITDTNDLYNQPTITLYNSEPISDNILSDPIIVFGVAESFDGFTVDGVEVVLTNSIDAPVGLQATANDGAFDETVEEFTLQIPLTTLGIENLYGAYGGRFIIEVAAIDSDNLQSIAQEFSGITELPPDSEVTFVLNNLGSAPINSNQVTYTGTAFGDETSGISVTNVQYSVLDDAIGTEVNWTDAVANDGTFDGFLEAFSFQTPPLVDGEKIIMIRVFGSNGIEFYSGILGNTGAPGDRINIDAVDTSAPLIELQPVIPNPTFDDTPTISGKVEDDDFELTTQIASIEYSLNGTDYTPINPVDGSFDELVEEYQFELNALSPGDYTIYIRAADTAGNQTTGGEIATFDFTIETKDTNIESVKVQKTSDFNAYLDFDSIASDEIIWGRGQLRLRESVSVASQTELSGSDEQRYGQRYKNLVPSHFVFDDNACGDGIFISQFRQYFSYYDRSTGLEYEFDLTQVGLFDSDTTQGLVSYLTPSGECHLWMGTVYNNIVAINFGTSIADGIDEYAVYDFDSDINYLETTRLTIDARDPNDYGVMYKYPRADESGGAKYIKPGASISSKADDQEIDYFATVDYNFNDTQVVVLNGNEWWFADYDQGITRYDDNGTPLNKADDQFYVYNGAQDVRYRRNFALLFNKDNQPIFGGDEGISMIVDYNGTFDGADDTVTYLATPSQLETTEISSMDYNSGDDIIGEQIWAGTRAGEIIYISTNNTPVEKRDDVIQVVDYASDFYPAQLAAMSLRDSDTLTIFLDRNGVYDVDMNIEFATQGTAITKIYSELEGDYEDLDFIELISVGFRYTDGSTSYRISNDAGFTWVPISVGQTVNFDNEGYEFVFAIDMFEGSTPVIDEFLLQYSAYPSDDQRGFLIDIEDEPPQVQSGSQFSFRVDALDDLLNPLEEDKVISLELRDITSDEVVDDFNIESILVPDGNGSVVINNAQSNVVGTYYIYAQSDSETSVSIPIEFVGSAGGTEPTTPNIPIPSLTFTASDYSIAEGDEVSLFWVSQNLENLVLSSDNESLELGSVDLNDTLTLNLFETTEFTLTGSGQYGNLESTLVIEVIPQESVFTSDPSPQVAPEVIVFEYERLEKDGDLVLIKLDWEVENAELVEIPGIGTNLPLVGSTEVYITEDTSFTIIATNDFGRDSEQIDVPYSNDRSELTVYGFTPLLATIILSGVTTMLLVPLSGSFFIDFFTKYGVLFGVIGRRKKRFWGFVLDIKTNEPIPFAVIDIYDGETFISHTVSDLDGRYGVILDSPGNYKLVGKANGYKLYEEYVKAEKIGEVVEVVEDIEMAPIDQKVNALSKLMFFKKTSVVRGLFVLSAISMVIGFVYTVIITTQYPNAINFLLLIIYGAFFAINIINLALFYARSAGKVLDSDTKQGVVGASVRFYKDNAQVSISLTKEEGIIKENLKEGTYTYLAHKAGYRESEMKEININEKGYMSEDITLEKS